jgi:hypothetical protein
MFSYPLTGPGNSVIIAQESRIRIQAGTHAKVGSVEELMSHMEEQLQRDDAASSDSGRKTI